MIFMYLYNLFWNIVFGYVMVFLLNVFYFDKVIDIINGNSYMYFKYL